MCDPTLCMSNILIDSSDGLPRRKRYWERPGSSLNGLWRHITDDAIKNRDSLTSHLHPQLSNKPCGNLHLRRHHRRTIQVTKILLRAPRVEKSACTTRRYTNFTQNSSWNNTAYLGLRRHAIYQTIRRRDQESRLNLKTTNQDVVPSKFLLIIISYFILSIILLIYIDDLSPLGRTKGETRPYSIKWYIQ